MLWLAWNWKTNDCQDYLVKEEATLEDSGLYCSRITLRCKICIALFHPLEFINNRTEEGQAIKNCKIGYVLVVNQFNWKLIGLVLGVGLIGLGFVLAICMVSKNPEIMQKWVSMPNLSDSISGRVSTSVLSCRTFPGRLSIGSQIETSRKF